jgi:hypothetical protein
MLMMRMALAGLLVTGMVWAQSAGDLFNRAPAGVEETVRARVSEYFTFQMDGKFRQAEGLVCAAGKDAYYDMEKTRWKSFEIVKTSYEDEFQTAKVVVLLGTTMNTPHGVLDAKYPYVSTWKLEQGQWCFYIDPVRALTRETPFGTMTAGPGDGREGGGGGFVTQEQVLASLKRGVRLIPDAVRLSSFEKSSARVEIVNALSGMIEVEAVAAPRKGLEMKLESTKVAAGSSTFLEFQYEPPDESAKETLEVLVKIAPSGQVLPLKVEFGVPQGVLQQIPEQLRKQPQP